jgi:hypothetical protein
MVTDLIDWGWGIGFIRWAATQRYLRRVGQLPPERERALDGIGFHWAKVRKHTTTPTPPPPETKEETNEKKPKRKKPNKKSTKK